MDLFSSLTDRIYAIDWRGIYNTVVIVISIIDAVLVALFLYVLRLFGKLDSIGPENGAAGDVSPVPVAKEASENWERIRELINSQNPSDWNMAIIQADALLDDILMHLGYEGDTMGDRLKIVDPVQLPSADRVWSAHRLRNTIVHDPMVEHTRETVINALRAYQDAFRELGVLKEEI